MQDAVGNRLSKTVDGLLTVNYAYDANDRLLSEGSTTYSYDANGNTLSKNDGSLTSYAYDAENRLIRAQTATDTIAYTYDANGIRQSQTVNGNTISYLVDQNRDYAQVLEERDSSNTLIVAYTHGDDLLSQHRGGTTHYYHYDGLGSTRALTDGTEATTDTYTYDAFGNLIRSTGTTPNNYLYAGEQYDPNIGFYYLRARYMNPENGRFLTTDPFPGLMHEPVTLHRYLYAGQNPISNIDPSGEFFGGIGGFVGLSINISIRTFSTSFLFLRGVGARAVPFIARFMGRLAVQALKPIFRAVGRLPLRTASGRRINSVDKFYRFFMSPTKRHPGVSWGPIGRLLKRAFPKVNWQQHHVAIQAKWFRPGSPSQWYPSDYYANLGLQRLGNAGFNLMTIPAGLNRALGRSGLGTAGLAIGSYGLVAFAVYEILDSYSDE